MDGGRARFHDNVLDALPYELPLTELLPVVLLHRTSGDSLRGTPRKWDWLQAQANEMNFAEDDVSLVQDKLSRPPAATRTLELGSLGLHSLNLRRQSNLLDVKVHTRQVTAYEGRISE